MFVLETIPCGWKLQGSYRFTMNPMKCEDVYRTRLNVVVTPALMSNYTEITGEKSFTKSDLAIFKCLVNEHHEFTETRKGKCKILHYSCMKCTYVGTR